MNNLITAKNIMRLFSRIASVAAFVYIFAIIFMRAADVQPLSTDDIALFSMLGTTLGILYIINYSFGIICTALKRQYKRKA